MAVDDKHPQYVARLPSWKVVIDCYEGEERVKGEATTYLPATSGMYAQGYGNDSSSLGARAYEAYRLRAIFHGFFRDAVIGMIGVVHRKPPQITVPPALEPMLKDATPKGESIEQLWRRVTEQQLVTGRMGLLVDVPDGAPVGQATPYIALYGATTVINWDVGQRRQGREKLELVVLDETEYERGADLSWNLVRQFRVLTLSKQASELPAADQADPGAGEYQVVVVREDQTGMSEEKAMAGAITPSMSGRTLEQIPFVFCNVNDLVSEPDMPPLIGLARLDLAIYRGEADYRQTLYVQGQPTLVRIGATDEQAKIPVGAGAVLDVQMGGDAKYVGAPADGIGEQRQSLENDKGQATAFTTKFLANDGGEDQSGKALRIRVSASTTTLATIQRAAAGAIRAALIHAGRWMGLSEDVIETIEVEPNLEFVDDKVDAATVSVIMDAKQKGLPMSLESIHGWLKENGFTVLTFEEEVEKILQERTDLGLDGGTPVEVDPNADPGEVDPPPPPGGD